MIVDRIPVPRGRIHAIRATRFEPDYPRGWIRDHKRGLWLKHSFSKNMVVLAGLSMMAKSIQYGHADEGKTIRYMEVGSGSPLPDKTDVALDTAVLRVEISSWNNAGIAADPVVMIASYLFGTSQANADLMEVGLFQESAGAPMYCRGLFGWGAISGATNADPCVVTAVGHGRSSGDKVYIENVSGMTEINDLAFYIDVLTADTFALYTDSGLTTSVDSSAYGVYTTGSPDNDTWKLIVPKSVAETLTVNYSLTYPAE